MPRAAAPGPRQVARPPMWPWQQRDCVQTHPGLCQSDCRIQVLGALLSPGRGLCLGLRLPTGLSVAAGKQSLGDSPVPRKCGAAGQWCALLPPVASCLPGRARPTPPDARVRRGTLGARHGWEGRAFRAPSRDADTRRSNTSGEQMGSGQWRVSQERAGSMRRLGASRGGR